MLIQPAETGSSESSAARSGTSFEWRPWGAALVAALLIALFWVANRGAYHGYFQDDDLDTLSWAISGSVRDFLYWLAIPRFHLYNFRPVGAFYYLGFGRMFGLDFPPYVAALQTIHVLNAGLLFTLLRRLRLEPFAALAGTLFFALHSATLEAYWKPMYIFDAACCMFGLLTLLLYLRGNWLLALGTFWLAYKSKEIAVMLPLVLAAYEWWLGGRRWKRLIPYFLISLNFGLQGLLLNQNKDNSYTLRFAPWALGQTISFYSSKVFFAPYAGLLLLPVPLLLRDRRVYFGLSAAMLLIAPLLALPGRLFSVYWYFPSVGVAIVIAAVAAATPRPLTGAALVLWAAGNFLSLRHERRAILAEADENRAFVAAIAAIGRKAPEVKSVVYEHAPAAMNFWGVNGAVHLLVGDRVPAYALADPQANAALKNVPVGIIHWIPARHEALAEIRR